MPLSTSFLSRLNDAASLRRLLQPAHIEYLRASFDAMPPGRHRLFQDESRKVVVWKWRPMAFIPLHGHGEKRCVWRVIDGRFAEAKFHGRGLPSVTIAYGPGDVAVVEADHQVMNLSDKCGLTLHVYNG